jgi:hypothetical protein
MNDALVKIKQALAEGYPAKIENDFLVVENPSFRPDNGEAPFLVAALSAQSEGMVMVPREPTPEMIEAFIDKAIKADDFSYGLKIASPVEGYRAMIAAAPLSSQDKESV